MRFSPDGAKGGGGEWAASFSAGDRLNSSESCETSTTIDGRDCNDKDIAEDEEERINEDVRQLARRFTAQSHGAPRALYQLPAEGYLDPRSPEFNAKKWAKAFYDIRRDALGGNAPKTTGVAFKNLDVFGFGNTSTFQRTVGNMFLEVGTIFNKFFRDSRQRIEILQDLEGVVHSGEMVAVLGPPGSGCSTFLKTIAGCYDQGRYGQPEGTWKNS